MKSLSSFKPGSFCRSLVTLCAVVALLVNGRLQATTYYWDNNSTTSGFGTAGGTWASPTLNLWSTDATGVGAPEASVTTTTADTLYFGTDTVALASGTITVSGTVAAGSLLFGKTSGNITFNGGTIDLSGGLFPTIGASSSAGSTTALVTFNSDIQKASGAINIGRQNTTGENYIFNGVISGGAGVDLRPVNNGAYVALNGLNTFSGNVNLVTGQVNVNTVANSGVASSLGAGTTFTMAGGGGQNPTLWFTGTSAASTNRNINLNGGFNRIVSQDAPLTLAGSVTGTSGSFQSTLTLTGDAGGGSNFNAISGTIGGNLKLEVSSFAPIGGSAEEGRWKLSGANTYTGTTTLNAGVLQADQTDVAGVSGALGNGGDILFKGGSLQYTANSASTDYSARIRSSTSAMTFDTNGQTVTFGTALATSNTGGLIKNGAGLLDIKMGTSYSGKTTINGGTLRFTNVSDLAIVSTTAFLINNGSTLEFQSSVGGANRTVLNGKTFTFDSSGGGTINFNGGNHLFQAAPNTHNFITTGGAKNAISSTNGGFMNMQGAGNPVFTVADGTDDWDLELSATWNNGLITKNGAGTMVITGSHSGNYAITINAGTLEVGGSARLNGGTFTAAITNDGVFKHSSTQVQTLSGNITGSGSLWKSAGAALTLSGINSYSGVTTVDAVLNAGSTTALSSNSAFTVNSGGNLILNANSSAIGSLAGAGTVKNENTATGTAATLTTGGDNTSTTFSGTIIDGPSGSGALSLVKTGSGTQTLTGVNTYSGTTTISGGSVILGSGTGTTGTGAVTVQTGSTILGTGVVRGTTFTLDNGATLRPGESAADSSHGTLTFTPASASGGTSSLQGSVILGITTATTVDASYGGNVLGSAGYNAWVDAVSGAGGHDRLVFNNPTSGTGYGVDFLTTAGSLQIVGSGFTPQQGMAFNVLDWGNLVTPNFSGFTFNSGYLIGNGDEGADLDLPDLTGSGLFWDFSRFTTSGVIVIVPEPSRALLLLVGIFGVWVRRRR